ncbi:helix-turn-helix domain-containing protein [Haliea sp.]|uniref:helix-turn-helix domain-containing protein n=1 Tax=Haliea sp. TaxID=1932666 RepID=UPI0025C21784|nr:helix-turn-helix domain-containing protein [Haliea sp.]|tara:strand:- start:207 stop:902 length:696 start_codon:yes stop_codon:yes gene_type:complete
MSDHNWKETFKKAVSEFNKLSAKDRAILINRLTKHNKSINKHDYQDREQELVWVVACEAYSYMLDTNESPKTCLEYAARKHYKDIDKVLAEKSKPCGSMVSKIIRDHDKHPVQQAMNNKGYFYRQSIKNSNNVWQMLNTLSTFRKAYEAICELERRVENLENNFEKLNDSVTSLREEILVLESKLAISNGGDKSEVVDKLVQYGINRGEIAELLGVDRRTIYRWENKKDNK